MTGKRLDVAGVLQLTDGTPVPGAELAVRCGPLAFATRTNADGRFTLRQIPEGTCHVTSKVARIDQTVRISPNLLRGSGAIQLVVPPVWRVKVKIALTPKGLALARKKSRPEATSKLLERGWRLEIDETCPAMEQPSILTSVLRGPASSLKGKATPTPARKVDRLVSLDGRRLVVGEIVGGKSWDLARTSGEQTSRGELLQITLLSARARPWMPLELRPPAAGGEVTQVPLVEWRKEGKALTTVLTTLDLSAPRQLVAVLACRSHEAGGLRSPVETLAELAATYSATGLRVTLAQVCRERDWIPPFGPLGPVLRGGPELLWALGAKPGSLVILDHDGQVLFRGAAVDDAVAFLERSWPLFAAVRQVSVRRAASVQAAESERLLLQAEELVKRRRYAEAHSLLDRALVVDPELAEARKLRAITRARLGDLSGALREVTWWRSSFGHESADDLMDEIQRVSAAR